MTDYITTQSPSAPRVLRKSINNGTRYFIDRMAHKDLVNDARKYIIPLYYYCGGAQEIAFHTEDDSGFKSEFIRYNDNVNIGMEIVPRGRELIMLYAKALDELGFDTLLKGDHNEIITLTPKRQRFTALNDFITALELLINCEDNSAEDFEKLENEVRFLIHHFKWGGANDKKYEVYKKILGKIRDSFGENSTRLPDNAMLDIYNTGVYVDFSYLKDSVDEVNYVLSLLSLGIQNGKEHDQPYRYRLTFDNIFEIALNVFNDYFSVHADNILYINELASKEVKEIACNKIYPIWLSNNIVTRFNNIKVNDQFHLTNTYWDISDDKIDAWTFPIALPLASTIVETLESMGVKASFDEVNKEFVVKAPDKPEVDLVELAKVLEKTESLPGDEEQPKYGFVIPLTIDKNIYSSALLNVDSLYFRKEYTDTVRSTHKTLLSAIKNSIENGLADTKRFGFTVDLESVMNAESGIDKLLNALNFSIKKVEGSDLYYIEKHGYRLK